MTLGITMIVKNESDVLATSLGGIKDVADEIVVVDTGSTDDTERVARAFNDRVYTFDWIDDFSAARNFALSKSTTDYWMWLDADDFVPEKTARSIARWKKRCPTADVVMMPYVMGYDAMGKPTFSFFRERIIKRASGLVWQGRVHEAVTPRGTIQYLNCPIVHAKPPGRSSGTRNLDIYRGMAARGEHFAPRERYYYSRELFFAGMYEDAAREAGAFLADKDGYSVNKADACITLSRCLKQLGKAENALSAALGALEYGPPSAESCCEIAASFFDKADYSTAAYWYDLALKTKPDGRSGAFFNAEYGAFIPLVWLAVCYDRLGDRQKAYAYHKKAQKLRPNAPAVIANQAYFAALGFADR